MPGQNACVYGLHHIAYVTARICIAGRDRARSSAKHSSPCSSSNSSWPALASARSENLCRTRHVGHREEGLEDEIVRVRLGVDNPEARQHLGIGTRPTRWLLGELVALDTWASCAVYSPMIRLEYSEDAFISCSFGLDLPGSKLHICQDSWLCEWFCTISSSNSS